ncbi:MAG: permease [Burkholderiales bacterium]|nr:permease [Anaerolineae bacterium]
MPLKRLSGYVGIVIVVALIALRVAGVSLISADDSLLSSFSTTLSIFSTRFLGIFIEAAPFLLLGTFTSGLIEAFVSREDIARLIPRNPIAATVFGAFMGIVFPVCECGVVPVARRLFTKGLPMSAGVTFLLAAPVMNPVVLVSTYIAFGFGTILIGRFVITAVVAIAVGLIFALNANPIEVLRPTSLAPAMGGSGLINGGNLIKPKRRPLGEGLGAAIQLAADEFFEMGRYLIIGSLLAAAMQTLVSEESLRQLGTGPVQSVIVMQALAFLLSVCSTVDAFLALAFAGTFTTGSILAFLTFGPMVDIKSTLMFLGVFRRRTVVYLIVLPLLMTMLIGIWTNLNLSFR